MVKNCSIFTYELILLGLLCIGFFKDSIMKLLVVVFLFFSTSILICSHNPILIYSSIVIEKEGSVLDGDYLTHNCTVSRNEPVSKIFQDLILSNSLKIPVGRITVILLDKKFEAKKCVVNNVNMADYINNVFPQIENEDNLIFCYYGN